MMKRREGVSKWVLVCVLCLFFFTMHSASLKSIGAETTGVDQYGNISEGKSSLRTPTAFSLNGGSILYFNPFEDTAVRLRSLGYTVTETTNVGDITRSNLQNYDLLWIGVGTDPTTYQSQSAEIQTWVNHDCGGFLVMQPNLSGGAVTIFPAGFEVVIYDPMWPGEADAHIVAPSHPIVQGLTDEDLGGNFDHVRSEDIGNQWNIVAVDLETPSDVALLAGEYGTGRLLFYTGNLCSMSIDQGSDAFVVQMVDWAMACGGGVDPDIDVTPTSLEITLPSNQTGQLNFKINNVGSGDLIVDNICDEEVVLQQRPAKENGTPEELSGGKCIYPKVSQELMVNELANSFTIAVAANDFSNTNEHDQLVSTLNSLGYGTVDVMSVSDAVVAGADAIIAYFGCYTFDITELDNWISGGKGYIQIGDWTDWFVNSWEYIGDTNSVDVTITNPGHPIAQGLPSSWSGVGFWEYGFDDGSVGWTTGYTEIGKLQGVNYALHDEGISVIEHGAGKAVYFGFNVYGSSAGQNDLQLFENALTWICGEVPEACSCSIDASWMSVSPSNGTVNPGGNMVVTVDFDTNGLADGTYNGNIKIASNDPDEPCVIVPVTLHVGGTPEPCLPGCEGDDSGALDIVDTASGPGGTVTVPVRIQSAPNAVGSLGFEVAFCTSMLRYTGYTRGNLVSDFDFFDCNVPGDKPYVVRCGGFKSMGGIAQGAGGDVVYLNFEVVQGVGECVKGEKYTLDLLELKDDIVSWSSSLGCFHCGCDCDVNGDGDVTPQDALCAFQKYLGIDPTACGPIENICCDVTMDNDCTPQDALEIFREYLGIVPNACSGL